MERYNRGASIEERPPKKQIRATKRTVGGGPGWELHSGLGDPLPDWSRGSSSRECVSIGGGGWIELNYYLICLTIFRGVLQIFLENL